MPAFFIFGKPSFIMSLDSNVYQKWEEATASLLNIARDRGRQPVPDRCLFYMVPIKLNVPQPTNLYLEVKQTRKTRLLQPAEAYAAIDALAPYCHDINFQLNRVSRKVTFVEISYLMRSELDDDYQQKLLGEPSYNHSKLHLPPYEVEGRRFDLNWRDKPLLSRWLARRQWRRYLKSRKRR